jgi:hypothetical protein
MDGIDWTVRRVGTPGLALGVLVSFFAVPPAGAQRLSGLADFSLQSTTASTLTVSIPTGSSMNFTLVQGAAANGSTPATISTSWDLNPGQVGTVSLYGYFTTPSAALTGTGYDIASTYVEGQMTTGLPTTYVPFTQTNLLGTAGGSLLLYVELITGINKTKTRTDDLNVRINLTASPAVPVGNYSGTLHIQAQAF